jgi:hypothetical protein
MTRQDLERLVKRFMTEPSQPPTVGGQGVKNLRTQCDTMQGRMICEWEAPDRDTLVEWLKKRSVRFRGEDEWIMLVQMEAVDGKMSG